MATTSPYYLDRFVRAQSSVYDQALAELQSGQKPAPTSSIRFSARG